MGTSRKFLITGEDVYGNKAVVQTDERHTAEHLIAAWQSSGFTDVKMTEPNRPGDALETLDRHKVH
jgi:hypothetical protein